MAEGHAGSEGKIIPPELLPLHSLDNNRHTFVIILQFFTTAIEQRFGLERAGVGARDGIGQGCQVFFRRTLVRAEEAIILAGKAGAEIILQLAGGAYDQRLRPNLIQYLLQF